MNLFMRGFVKIGEARYWQMSSSKQRPDPINIFSVQNYAMLIFKHSDWLLPNFIQ